MFGSYVDAKFMRGLKVMRVSVDIPIEHSNDFLRAFGAPDGADPVPVAIARLVTPPAEPLTAPKRGEAQDEDKPRTPFRELKRSAQAAMKCQEPSFHDWLCLDYRSQIGRCWPRDGMTYPEMADMVLKEALGITSKKELDTSEAAGAAWDRMLCTYEYRDRA